MVKKSRHIDDVCSDPSYSVLFTFLSLNPARNDLRFYSDRSLSCRIPTARYDLVMSTKVTHRSSEAKLQNGYLNSAVCERIVYFVPIGCKAIK